MRRAHVIAGLLTCGLIAAAAVSAMDTLPKSPPVPPGKALTPAKVSLGKQLFFDPRISRSGTVSCNSCHNVMEAGEDDRPTAIGVDGKKGGRSAPTVWNAAYLSVQFWDGRAASLEEQAKGPMVNPLEMGMADHTAVVDRIAAIPGYQKAFRRAFGGSAPVTIDHIAEAIAAYERTLVTPRSAFDRAQAGETAAMTPAAKRGMTLVNTIGCTSCHNGPVFAGPPMAEGTGFFMKFPLYAGSTYETTYKLTDDLGRYTVTHDDADKNVWRVPMWRNVAITAPYFHNGSVPTLADAVRVMGKTQLNRDLSRAEVADIVAFLDALTGEFPAQTMPRLPAMPHESAVN